MSISRRGFLRTIGVGGAGSVSAAIIAERAWKALASVGLTDGEIQEVLFAQSEDLPVFGSPIPGLRDSQVRLKLHGNENPRGPGDAAIQALKGKVEAGSRLGWYPQNWGDLRGAIAKRHGVKPENVLLATASGPLLPAAVRAFTSSTKALVTGQPSFEAPEQTAKKIGTPVKAIPVDRAYRLDLDAMSAAATGAGLLFVNNPNNPTATAHSGKALADLVARVKKASPRTAVLVDEAYIDFADDPAAMTAVSLSIEYGDVIVTRTFSKAFGMGNLRLGYAVGQPKSLQALDEAWGLGSVSGLTAAAAIAALSDPSRIDRLREENRTNRAVTLKAFNEMGYSATESQTNFLFVDVKRPTRAFREACVKEKVLVARDFPPLSTHCRISIGTLEQMHEAIAVFRKVLSVPPTAA